jgi:FAD binding domain
MPCQDGAVCPSRPSETVRDYHRLNVYRPTRIYTPRTKQELVAAIIEIEADGRKAKALGSNMSFSAVARSDDCLIETHELNKHLSFPREAGNAPWPAERFRDGVVTDRLATMMAAQVTNKSPKLVYVEGGVKIRDLLGDLAQTSSPGLALPAMGAGGAQSIAGSLATGTHGAEMDRQPLMDSIRAVHLVGPGGQEWWIERSNGFTDPARLPTSVPDWCPDTRIVYDDRLFYSVIVSAGRLGVIYSLVLELEGAYWLEERRIKEPYAPLRQQLVDSALSGFTSPAGIMSIRSGLIFLGVVLNLNTESHCWVMERRIYDGPKTEIGIPKGGITANGFCSRFTGGGVAGLYIANALRFTPPNLFPIVVTRLMDEVLNRVEGEPPRKVGPSYRVMDQMDYSAPTDCAYGDQSEFFFNAGSTEYLEFVDQVCQAAADLGGVPGYVNMRFTQQSDAYMAMEQFPMTVGIEIVVLRPSFNGRDLLTTAAGLAESMGGIPHWGKDLFAARSTSLLPGRSVECYQYAITLTEEGHPSTFSSQFTRDSGLERLPGVSLQQLDQRTDRGSVSLRQLFAAAQTRLAMPARPRSLVEVARRFAPSLRMNAGGVPLPRGRASAEIARVRLRDLSRRIL